ncbi:glycosyltransferase family 2 protein [Rubneribacter badeniensis]|nr:glycosyltransferase family 2 protein [Rubneribacter badeniensis]
MGKGKASASIASSSGIPPKVSVVIPCYYSEKTIAKVVEGTRAELRRMGLRYEFVLVNDGSTDGTFDEICKLSEVDPCVVGINFARNFGQHNAIIAGLRHASGDYVMLMDDDMQTHPSQCEKLLDVALEGVYDVVFAKYPDHREAWWRRLGSNFTLWTMRVLTGRPKDIEASNFLVMKRFISDELTRYDGPYVYIQGLLFQATRKMANVAVEHFDREVGTSGYTFKSLFRLWSTVLNFSMVPLRLASLVGAVLGAVGLVFAVVVVVQRIFDPSMQMGWSSIMAVLLMCSGLVLLFLGLIGEYLGRLFMTVNKMPQYVLRKVVGGKGEGVEDAL